MTHFAVMLSLSQRSGAKAPVFPTRVSAQWCRYVRLFATPWTVARHAPLPMGISRQEYRSRLPCPPPGDLPDQGIEPTSPASPALQMDSLLLSHQGIPISNMNLYLLCARLCSQQITHIKSFKLMCSYKVVLYYPHFTSRKTKTGLIICPGYPRDHIQA